MSENEFQNSPHVLKTRDITTSLGDVINLLKSLRYYVSADRGVTGVDVEITSWLINYNFSFQYRLSEHGDSWFAYPRKLFVFGKGLQK